MSESTEALQAQVQELLQFVYLMPVAIVKLGAQGEVQLVNPKAVQLLEDLDIDLGTQDGLAMLEALTPGLRDTWKSSSAHVGEICAPIQVQRLVHGRDRHFVLKLVRPDWGCTMLVIEEVTDIVEKEREISRQRQRFSLVMEQIEGYCIVMLDAQGKILEWNLSIGRMFGEATRQLEGQPVDVLLNLPATSELPSIRFDNIKSLVSQQGAYRCEAAHPGPNGEVIWGDLVATPTMEESGAISGYVFVIRDITEQHSTKVRLQSDAFTDPLTGLLNRRGLEHRVSLYFQSESDHSKPASWIMADIDHFKKVNDTYGHDAGDEVLQAFAQMLKAATREGDTIARLGGEEFLILLAGAPLGAAMNTAEHMRASIEKTMMQAQHQRFHITSSFGVVAHSHASDWRLAVKAADAALYEAKTSGRNRVVVGKHGASG